MASGTIGDVAIIVDRITGGKRSVLVSINCSIHGASFDNMPATEGLTDVQVIHQSLREFREARGCTCAHGKSQRVVASLETIVLSNGAI